MTLRDYQQDAVSAVYNHLRTRKDNPCVVIPPGGGKSHVIAQIISDTINIWNGRALMLTHQKELIEQNVEKLKPLIGGVGIGIYCAGLDRRDTRQKVIAASIQSVVNRASELGKFDIILVDENQLIPEDGEGQYLTFLKAAKEINPDIRIVGFTATPFRLSGGMVCKPGNMINHVCYEISIKELIVKGFLSKLITKQGLADFDTSTLHVRANEFVKSEMEALFSDEEKIKHACSEIIEKNEDRHSCLIFASSIESGGKICRFFNEAGYRAHEIYGDTLKADRSRLLHEFKNGDFQYLINVGVLTTGIDVPGIDCIALLRATMSPGLLVQMIGRGTRLFGSKTDCLILDYGENIIRHGPIDKITVKEVRKQSERKKDDEPLVVKCPNCRSLLDRRYDVCPDCGESLIKEKRVTHNASASEAPLFADETKNVNYRVHNVYYFKHEKLKKNGTNSITMRVEYLINVGFHGVYCEYVCFEHSGYARGNAESWWRQRAPDTPVPSTVDEALGLANSGILPVPFEIVVKEGGKWPEIVEFDFEVPEGHVVETKTEAPKLKGKKIEYGVAVDFEDWKESMKQEDAISGALFDSDSYDIEGNEIPF